MQAPFIGAFAPAILLCAALGSWSLISLLFLLAFFVLQYDLQRRALHARSRQLLWISLVLLATTVIVAEGTVELVWAILGSSWNLSESSVLKVLGLARLNPWHANLGVLLSLLPQFAVALIAACALYQEQQRDNAARRPDCGEVSLQLKANLRNVVLPAVQLIAGVARPSWIALPYFACSCVSLLRWSMASNRTGIFWGRQPLLCFTGIHILLLYIFQLPISLPGGISGVADYVGLFKASYKGWPECVQVIALIALYILLCHFVDGMHEDQASQQAADDGFVTEDSLPNYYRGTLSAPPGHSSPNSLTQALLPSQGSDRETISLSMRWDTEQRRISGLQHATINFITCCFPICLIALVSWSFIYESLCAFGLLLYVGYIFYAFPSIHILRQLNPMLLGFILAWCLSTYVFNAAFKVIAKEAPVEMEVWHFIGLWHYLTPGLFIFAQFALGVLVATDIFLSNTVLKNVSEEEPPPGDDQVRDSDHEDWKVFILAVTAWCLRRSGYVISLALILLVGMKGGLLNAVYMGVFLIYMVSSEFARRTRQRLILFCEVHFAILYLLHLDWISEALQAHEVRLKPILLQLGLWDRGNVADFLSIALLLCFLAVQSHGVNVLSSLSATVHQGSHHPRDWGLLRVGSGRSVLLSVYASQNFGYLQQESSIEVNWVTRNLAAVAERIRATYRSFGTYIVWGTVMTVIYFVEPNYISLGYLCLLLVWVIGRQIMGHTDARLWYPLMVFSGIVFIFRYALTAIPALQDVTSEWFSLHHDFGFDKNASLLGHLWDSLVILAAMQLYRFEREQAVYLIEQPGQQVFDGQSFRSFSKRVIILHCGKVLTFAVFYASITPVSASGFLYLMMLITTCNMSKSSRLPGQLYSVYTGFLMVIEYLFQMWGDRAGMFPGQAHGDFAHWLGFRIYREGFFGTELGVRSKVLVLLACILQYCSYHWLDQLTPSLRLHNKHDEPCPLFLPYRWKSIPYQRGSQADAEREKDCLPGSQTSSPAAKISGKPEVLHRKASRNSYNSEKGRKSKKVNFQFQDHATTSSNMDDVEVPEAPDPSNAQTPQEFAGEPASRSPWGDAKESRRWTKRAGMLVKQERYAAQLRTLNLYAKHILENFLQLYGLEMSMLSFLVASFALLNIISLFYILVLGFCIVLSRRTLRTIWPFFVVLFALILVTEYAVLGNGPPSWSVPPSLGEAPGETHIPCNSCARNSNDHLGYCWKCWLGLMVDDWQILGAHFMVFFVTSLQLRANMFTGNQRSQSIHSVVPIQDRLAWKELSFETRDQWTWFDHVRFLFYRHLLHAVLFLVFVTGTLQYDVLHLGYLTFSLVLFRMRSTLMVKRNSILRFLRLYNFVLIGASLLYQAPFFGTLGSEQCTDVASMYSVIGLYKMKFGFHITGRSALVDMTIFCITGLQAHIFQSRGFDQVLRYLESERVEARAHSQEHKASWKKGHLELIRATEEKNLQRRLQVEKMKTDMIHLQSRLDVLSSEGTQNGFLSPMVELGNRGGPYPSFAPIVHSAGPLPQELHAPRDFDNFPSQPSSNMALGSKDGAKTIPPSERSNDPDHHVRRRPGSQAQGLHEIVISGGGREDVSDGQSNVLVQTCSPSDTDSESALASSSAAGKEDDNQRPGTMIGVQLLDDGMAQVQDLGNKALANLVGLLNLEPVDGDDTEDSTTDDEVRPGDKASLRQYSRSATHCKNHEQVLLGEAQGKAASQRIDILCWYLWSKISSNTDIICYFFFVVVYVWNFSYLTLVYPAVLFLYALLANPGPSQQFWVFMLVYTELNILLQYMYQIHVQKCGDQEASDWLQKLGIPRSPMKHSFVLSVLPLFLVYLNTLVQSSIKARDGEWMFVDESRTFSSARRLVNVEYQNHHVTVREQVIKIGKVARDAVRNVGKGLFRYWSALGNGSEAPPHFVQVSMLVGKWPEDGIQPGWIESRFNRLLAVVHELRLSEVRSTHEKDLYSRVRVEGIEQSLDNPTIALAVLEVIYAAPPQGYTGVDHQTLTPAADVAAELLKAKDGGHVEEADFPFPIISVIPGGKKEVDLYALIFGTDLICFLYVALLYTSTKKKGEQILEVYKVQDQFPKEFVFVLMTLFFLMMMYRVLYLWSFATGKALYYFFSIGLYTAYISEFVWEILLTTERNPPLSLRGFYLLKSLSLALQAVQLKYGSPHKSALFRQFLTREINFTSWLGFCLYRSMPFLYELRCLLDWSCTITALAMYDWLKLEDIYASLFLVQCNIKMVREKHQVGQKQSVWIKFCSGVLLFSTLIGIIWAPMMIYSNGNPTNLVNQIQDVRMRIDVKTNGGTFNLFQTSLCQVPSLQSVQESTSTDAFDDVYSALTSSELQDVQLICCAADTDSQWIIPPPTIRSLLESIDEGLIFHTRLEFSRERPKGKEVTPYTRDARDLNGTVIAGQFGQVLNGTRSSLHIPNMYPRYLRVPGSGDVHQQSDLEAWVGGNLTLNRKESTWWSFLRDDAFDGDGCGEMKGPIAVTVSEEVPPTGIIGDTLSKFSIWSLYITFVLAFGRFIRIQCADIRMRIPFENFPACDRLLAICEDIYAARAAGELELEEGLFWTLIKIYRSPNILMEYTKVE